MIRGAVVAMLVSVGMLTACSQKEEEVYVPPTETTVVTPATVVVVTETEKSNEAVAPAETVAAPDAKESGK